MIDAGAINGCIDSEMGWNECDRLEIKLLTSTRRASHLLFTWDCPHAIVNCDGDDSETIEVLLMFFLNGCWISATY